MPNYCMLKALVIIFFLMMGIGMMALSINLPYYLSGYNVAVACMGVVFVILALIAIFKMRD
jgi:hypothetical protein